MTKHEFVAVVMAENGISREKAEQYVDDLEQAYESFCHPEWDIEAERIWNERNPRLRDSERI